MADSYVSKDPYLGTIPKFGEEAQQEEKPFTLEEGLQDVATGAYSALNVATGGIPSVITEHLIESGHDPYDVLRDFEKVRRNSPTARRVGGFIGAIAPYTVGAALAPEKAIASYFGTGLRGSMAKEIAGFAAGGVLSDVGTNVENEELTGWKTDSYKSAVLDTVKDIPGIVAESIEFGGPIGAAIHYAPALKAAFRKFTGKDLEIDPNSGSITSQNMPAMPIADDIDARFDIAADRATDPFKKSVIQENKKIYKDLREEEDALSKTEDGITSQRYKTVVKPLTDLLHTEDFIQLFSHPEEPKQLKKVIEGRTEAEAIQDRLSKETGIDASLLNVREKLTSDLERNLNDTAEAEAELEKDRDGIVEDISEFTSPLDTDTVKSQVSGKLTEASQSLSELASPQSNADTMFASNILIPKEDSITTEEAKVFGEALSKQQKGPSPKLFDKYHNIAQGILETAKTQLKTKNSVGDVFTHVKDLKRRVNKLYKVMKDDAGVGASVPSQYKAIYDTLLERVKGLSKDKSIFGETAHHLESIDESVREKMNARGDLMRATGQNPSKEVLPGFEEKGDLSVRKRPLYTAFDPKALNRFKLSNMGNGNISLRGAFDAMNAYYKNTLAQSSRMVSAIDAHLSLLSKTDGVLNNIEERLSGLDLKADELKTQPDSELKTLQSEILSKEIERLTSRKSYFSRIEENLKTKRDRIIKSSERIQSNWDKSIQASKDLTVFNTRRVNNFMEFLSNTNELSKKALGKSEGTVGFKLHTGTANPTLETFRFARDTLTGYTPGQVAALVQLSMYGGGKLVEKYIGKKFLSEVELFNAQRVNALKKRNKLISAARSKVIRLRDKERKKGE